jgi:CPA1 family monovalent cation:H+ antiporter
LRPPHRILTILEGESLLNDATALLIFRLAIGAVAADGFSIGAVAPAFVLGVVGSVLIGPALGWLVLHLLERVQHVPTSIILQFVTTISVWLLAEQLDSLRIDHGVLRGDRCQTAPARTPARLRIPTHVVRETVVFALNVLAFIFIGLQIRPILEACRADLRQHCGGGCGAAHRHIRTTRLAYVLQCRCPLAGSALGSTRHD